MSDPGITLTPALNTVRQLASHEGLFKDALRSPAPRLSQDAGAWTLSSCLHLGRQNVLSHSSSSQPPSAFHSSFCVAKTRGQTRQTKWKNWSRGSEAQSH
jgi:hypothetical protein